MSPPEIPYLSNVTGTWITAEQATDPRYWAEHMVGTVRFGEGLGELLRDPARVLLEVGPGGTLGTLARQHPAAAPGQEVLSALRHASEERADRAHLLAALGRLWLAGATIDWSAFYAGERRRRVPLPTYPFERQRYWIDPPRAGAAAEPRTTAAAEPANRERIDDWFYLPVWREAPALLPPAAPAGPWLVLADGSGLGERLAARLREAGQAAVVALRGERLAEAGSDRLTEIGPDRFAIGRPAERESYLQLLQELRATERFPARVVHLWSLDPLAGAGFAAAQERGLLSLLALVQAVGELAHAQPVAIGVVASGLFAVADGDRLEPEKAPLAGLCRVVPQEYPHIGCRLLDVELTPPGTPGGLDGLAAAVLAEMEMGTEAAGAIALRGRRRPRRWLRGFEPVALPETAAGATRLREGGVYIVTDAAHGTGLALAEELRRALGARLAVVRPASPPTRAGWAARLDALLAADGVLALDVDPATEAGARAALARTRERFGAVDGVFHTAAEFAGGVVQLKTRASLPAVFGAPVQGGAAWTRLAAEEPLGFLVLAASTSAVTGGFGQVDACAAGCALGALAESAQDSAGGGATHVVAVDWDPYQWDSWLAGGLAETPGMGGSMGQDIARFGVDSRRSLEALRRLLATGAPRLVVSAQDLAAAIADTDAFHAADLVAQMERGKRARAPREGAPDLYAAPRNETEEKLAAIWEDLFGIAPIGVDESFLALGGHSLLAIQLATEIRNVFGVELQVSALFEHPTVAELARAVAAERGEAEEEDLDRLLAEVESLSEDELARLLAAEREAERAEAGA